MISLKKARIYNNIDCRYKQMYDFELEESKTLDGVPISEQLPNILSMITESKVIYISEDASTIGNYHIVEAETHPNGNTIWNGILEIYQNGILTKTLTQNIDELGYGDYASGGFLDVYNGAFAVAPINEPTELYDYRLKIHNDSETLLYEYHYYDDYDHVVMIYDKDSLNYVVEFADEMSLFDINQFIDERYLVFTIYGKYTHNVYMLDLKTSEMTHLMNYCFNPILSPDMKYLAYTSYSMYHLGVNTHVKEDIDLPSGFYVKNLETGSTAFYQVALDDYMTHKEHQTLGWVNTKALLSE
ncbi:MAG: hypothetical protein E7613_06815 [Ruminococcaceae bacterium]|nr:hypothetical protein [Oscillospiraceae bacterium]